MHVGKVSSCASGESAIKGHNISIEATMCSTIGEGRGCNKFVPVLGGDGTKIASPGDCFYQPPGHKS